MHHPLEAQLPHYHWKYIQEHIAKLEKFWGVVYQQWWETILKETSLMKF